MDTGELLRENREEILALAARHGARTVRVSGSAARGEMTQDSDVDFLVEMDEERSLLDNVALWQDLQDLLGCEVDVVSEGGLHWYIRERVLEDAVPL